MLKTINEDIKMYLPGSAEKKSLKAELEKLENQHFEIPIIINGKVQFNYNNAFLFPYLSWIC